MLIQKLPPGSIYGFVVEEPTAGGHNAPPRNKINYGEKDYVDYKKLSELGLPFWIGGGYTSPSALHQAMQLGAAGIQVGSIFALSEESGMNPDARREVRGLGFRDELKVRTDMRISPTGFPFKVIELPGTISENSIYESRKRICNIGGLVSLYEKEDGKIRRRCAAEPVDKFLKKGGKLVLAEVFADRDRPASVFVQLFALNMLIQTEEGCVFTESQLAEMLAEAGFRDVIRPPLPYWEHESPVLIATK